MKLLLFLIVTSLFLNGCALMVGAAAGGAAGYYAGEKGYKVKVEKERD
ncbi:hypothetical protein BCF55_0555 [Hydrogenivirga caldilitoris]|uniref:Lipoprotein n=1 Tax=Hydrogenivirga caldilitoris TaxID=246264 RepID=A0A497XMW5_9AQUI|nr:hypothetical protein [Hydrogenivirga caldilitoris]RLJ70287.1 hypothetical protein BCF55_0555 [Hydrogenivirga caldilitoris]